MDKGRKDPCRRRGLVTLIYVIPLMFWEIDFLCGLVSFLSGGGLRLLNSSTFTREAKQKYSKETLKRIGQYINRGNKHFARREYSKAVELWTAVEDFLSPWSSVCISNNLACAHSRMGHHAWAFQYIRSAETIVESRSELRMHEHLTKLVESNRRQIEQASH
jgi:hypothetical protein